MISPVIEYENQVLKVLDQTLLPEREEVAVLSSLEEVALGITDMKVRGAPLIGATAAFGVCVALSSAENLTEVKQMAPKVIQRLASSRPTAVNLFWVLERMERAIEKLTETGWREELEQEARLVLTEIEIADRKMAKFGGELLCDGAKTITHCNTGPLATGAGGTALGVLISAGNRFKDLHVYVRETRPRWQGARLTAWELEKAKVAHTILVDSATAALMREGAIHSVWVGADRIARNGDTANKIGTYSLAVSAAHHSVPFYVVAPTSTLDRSLSDGSAIPIEERDPAEVLSPAGVSNSSTKTKVWNPAFGFTPAELITAIITEEGVSHGPK